MAAFRRDRNLADILVHGKLKRDLQQNEPTCKSGCKTCNMLMGNSTRCKDRGVVYGLACTKCDKIVYVGETGRELQERITEHMRDIRLKRDKPVSDHFNEVNHSLVNLRVTCLEKVIDRSHTLRLIRETAWINRLNTKYPQG